MVRSPSSAILADRAPPGRGSDRIRRAGGELATRRSRRSSAGCSRVSSRAGPAITADHEKAVKHRRRSNHGTDLGSGSAFNHLMGSAAGSGSQHGTESVSLSVLFSRRRSVQRQRPGSGSQRGASRPFLSPSCSREDDILACQRLVRVLITLEENAFTFSPSFSLGSMHLPWAPLTLNAKTAVCPEARRPRPRICLRKGCGRKYQPRRWNQRYCQDPECLREVRRWQAARRQAKRRQDAARQSPARPGREAAPPASQSPRPKAIENPEVAPARGHAAEIFFPLPYAIGRAATNPP